MVVEKFLNNTYRKKLFLTFIVKRLAKISPKNIDGKY